MMGWKIDIPKGDDRYATFGKRYLIFNVDHPYPMGGLGDAVNSFDDLLEAQKFAADLNGGFVYIYDKVDNVTWDYRPE